jgi:hypothetical protein
MFFGSTNIVQLNQSRILNNDNVKNFKTSDSDGDDNEHTEVCHNDNDNNNAILRDREDDDYQRNKLV